MDEDHDGPGVLYALPAPRLRAMVIDVAVFVGFIAVMIVIASAAPRLLDGQWFGILFVVALNLYEPVLVSVYGGTVGHQRNNLRVERASDGRNLNFFVAFARWWIKWLFGVVSFLAMLVTRRHQAIHDIATRSVVTVRDSGRASARDFEGERLEPIGATEVPAWRRVLATVGYGLALTVPLLLAPALLVSEECSLYDACTQGEDTIWGLFGTLWLLGLGAAAWAGWTGRLPGARPSSPG